MGRLWLQVPYVKRVETGCEAIDATAPASVFVRERRKQTRGRAGRGGEGRGRRGRLQAEYS
jgi:hypothetical protein